MTATSSNPRATADGFAFDYEDPRTVEGRGQVRIDTRDLAALRLERALAALKGTRGSLLEIGCGAGRNLRAFEHYLPGLKLHGVDISQIALNEARGLGGAIDYALGDALNLPFPDASFDVVVFFDLLEHVTDTGRSVDEVARVLKPGGVFHGFVPCEGNGKTIFALLRKSKRFPIHRWKRDHIGHIQILTTRELATLFKRRGFDVTGLSYSFHLLGQIHDVVDYWQREQLAGGKADTTLKRTLVKLFSKAVFIPTWRLAYYEDNARRNDPRAIGVHITARKRR